jgi:predicted amidophosphoribosyltransferase
MAIIECAKCHHKVSDEMAICAFCRAPTRSQPAAAPPNLQPCRECARPLSPSAKACPGCGAADPTTPRALYAIGHTAKLATLFITIPILLLGALGVCSVIK